ncbi:MAG: hypothetical protein ACM3YE_01200 [Bacteroidota bacterium]
MPKLLWLLLTVLFIFSVVEVNAEERWRLILDGEQIKHFFDVDSIKVVSDNDNNRIYLDVWIKVAYNGTEKNTYRESLRKAQIPTQGYENFGYAINHVLFEDGRVCLLGVYDYTNTGVILRSFDSPLRHWLDIVPGSTIEVWYQQVMAFATANMRTIIERMRDYTGENGSSHFFI